MRVFSLFYFQPQNLCDIESVVSLSITRDDEVHKKVDISLKDPDKEVRAASHFSYTINSPANQAKYSPFVFCVLYLLLIIS